MGAGAWCRETDQAVGQLLESPMPLERSSARAAGTEIRRKERPGSAEPPRSADTPPAEESATSYPERGGRITAVSSPSCDDGRTRWVTARRPCLRSVP